MRRSFAALAVVGAAMCVAAAVVTATGTPTGQVWLEALARALTVAAPLGVALYALRRPPFQRFGGLLFATGAVWFLTTLTNADDSLLYSVGRIAAWVVEPMLLYLLLVFPSGRLVGRVDRTLVAVMVLMVLTLYLPTALLVEQYPLPGPWMSCDSACPANAFMVVGSEPAFVEDVVRPLRDLLVILLFLAVAARLAWRIRGSTRLVRRTIAPVLTVACLRCGVYGSGIAIRQFAPDSTALDVWLWALGFMLALTSLAFLMGLLRWWVFIGQSTRRLAAGLRGHPGPDEVRGVLAEAFDDPSLEIVHARDDVHWTAPDAAAGRCVTEIRDGDRLLGAIVHDRTLADDPAFVETAAAYTAMTLTDHARLQAAAAGERLRIERDLHDGAQQRLVALGINLGIAADRTGREDGEHAAAVMRRLAEEVERTLEELRSLTHGEDPAGLADRGLVIALHAAALRNPVPTTVHAAVIHRHAPEIERAAYFCAMEAMQNAAKHAHGATAVVVEVCDADGLRLEVRDDGVGFDRERVTGGLGLRSMADRLAAVGGELAIVSSVGDGTRVIAQIPSAGDATGATSAPSRSETAPPG
ncbi:histidine kinase [Solirubrobacter taibaiensis]|nr:histidine kinase [Solirubrobacter taibaiensis]